MDAPLNGLVARDDVGGAGNLRRAGESRLNEGLRPDRNRADNYAMSKVRLVPLILVAVLFALMLAGAHHPIGMNDGGYW